MTRGAPTVPLRGRRRRREEEEEEGGGGGGEKFNRRS
jgi:hypothetical protein